MLKEECNTTNLAALRSWGMGKQAKGAVRSELWLLLFISFLSSPCHNGTTLPLRQGDKTLLKISHSSPLLLPPYHSFALRSRPVLVSSSHSTPPPPYPMSFSPPPPAPPPSPISICKYVREGRGKASRRLGAAQLRRLGGGGRRCGWFASEAPPPNSWGHHFMMFNFKKVNFFLTQVFRTCPYFVLEGK